MSEPAALATQVRCFIDRAARFDPDKSDEAMLAHVGAQLEAMAGQQAA